MEKEDAKSMHWTRKMTSSGAAIVHLVVSPATEHHHRRWDLNAAAKHHHRQSGMLLRSLRCLPPCHQRMGVGHRPRVRDHRHIVCRAASDPYVPLFVPPHTSEPPRCVARRMHHAHSMEAMACTVPAREGTSRPSWRYILQNLEEESM
jgi:hypothetical protein